MMKQVSFSFALSFLLTCCLVACEKQPMDQGPIRLGAIYNQSGIQADLDLPARNGAELAVSEINASGGIQGRQVELILKDGESDTSVVAAKVEEIIEEAPEVPAIFGLSDSDLALAAGTAAKASNRLFLTSGATSPLLPGQVPGYLYLACFGDNVQAAAAAEWAYADLNARTVAVLYDSTETYTRLLHRYFMERFESLGGQVVSVQGFDPEQVDQIGQGLPDADMIFLASEIAPEAVSVIHQLRQNGITKPIVGGDGYDSEEVWQNNPDINNIFFTTHVYLGDDNPNMLVTEFRNAYVNAYGDQPDAFAALGYDAVNLLKAAITQAGSTDPDKVRLALGELQDIPGVTGVISFTGGSQIPKKSVSVIEVNAGQKIFLKELIPSVVPNP